MESGVEQKADCLVLHNKQPHADIRFIAERSLAFVDPTLWFCKSGQGSEDDVVEWYLKRQKAGIPGATCDRLKLYNDAVGSRLEPSFTTSTKRFFAEEFLRAAPYFLDAQSAAHLYNRHHGKRLFLLGSGPSLKKNIDLLNKHLENDTESIVMCCNMAGLNLNRKPDYLVFTEREFNVRDWPRWHNINCHNLITWTLANHTAFGCIGRNQTFLCNLALSNGLCDVSRKLWAYLHEHDRMLLEVPFILETMTLAILMSWWMGFGEIVCLGMDYSFTADDGYYAAMGKSDVFYGKVSVSHDKLVTKAREVEDIYGNTVLALKEQSACLTQTAFAFEKMKLAGVKTYNCTEGGCLKDGMTGVMSLHEYLDKER